MKEKILASRYAEAFVGYASKTSSLQDIVAELKGLKMLIRDNPEIHRLFKSRELTYVEKCAFLDAVLGGAFSAELVHLVKLLLRKNRTAILIPVSDYARVKYASQQAVSALLLSAYPLDSEVINLIRDSLEKKLNKKLKLYLGIDGDLLAGVRVVIGNTIIDGSVRRGLNDLKERLLTLKVN